MNKSDDTTIMHNLSKEYLSFPQIKFRISINCYKMWMDVKILTVQILLLIGVVLIKSSDGHGMVLDPVNRASRWRYNVTALIDYEDNGVTCGGYEVIILFQKFSDHLMIFY